ncbi:MAG: metalloregulator ArsR/SmtB family transcription factor [Pseudomonadota bacterium]
MSICDSTTLSLEDLERFARMFKALANPHRLRILLELTRCLSDDGGFETSVEEMKNCQGEFAADLGLAPSTVSHHFKELRQAGLLRTKREGKTVRVWVETEALQALRGLLA